MKKPTAPRMLSLALLTLALGAGGCGEKSNAAATAEEGGPADAAKAYPRGPHNGRLLGEKDFQTEVTIYERGVPPVFRIYFYADGKPVPPSEVKLEIVLQRLGGRVDSFRF